MRSDGSRKPHRIALTNTRTCTGHSRKWWRTTPATAATSPGDLVGSGTVSGPDRRDDSLACSSELTVRGTEPIALPTGEKRTCLVDGDEITLRAHAKRTGYVSIGFGECKGRIDPAVAWPAKAARDVAAG